MSIDGPQVGIVMGSSSDLDVMAPAADLLEGFGVRFELRVVSAHRTPEAMLRYGLDARDKGIEVIIAGAGGAAHLPGRLASVTSVPVIGVPVALARLDGLDSLLSIVQMPRGVPVATVAVNASENAALLAVRILAVADPALHDALDRHRATLAETARDQDAAIARGDR